MDKFSDLLPEFFYDLIARITPGAVLCAALAWNVRQRVPVTELDPVIGFPVALMASYLAGFLLDNVSAMTLGEFALRIFRIFATLGTRFPLFKGWKIDGPKPKNGGLIEEQSQKINKGVGEK